MLFGWDQIMFKVARARDRYVAAAHCLGHEREWDEGGVSGCSKVGTGESFQSGARRRPAQYLCRKNGRMTPSGSTHPTACSCTHALTRFTLPSSVSKVYPALVRLEVTRTEAELWLKLRSASKIVVVAMPCRARLQRGERAVYMVRRRAWLKELPSPAKSWGTRSLSTPVCTSRCPRPKLAATSNEGGGRIVKLPSAWWQVMLEHEYPGMSGVFIHPVACTRVMAGNDGSLELEDLPGPTPGAVWRGGLSLDCIGGCGMLLGTSGLCL